MLTDGFNHVAILTKDSARLHAFYLEVFDAPVRPEDPAAPADAPTEGFRLSIIDIGPHSELNVFQIDGNAEAEHQVPMFGRGRIDHLALQAASMAEFDTIRDRLMMRGSTDGFVTDFGPILSLFFRDPDGLECEVCVDNPNAEPGVTHPPGTPAAGYNANER
jgi:catechol 2,3-dioxygenase-like lactoylglutathione lyase family enzyme